MRQLDLSRSHQQVLIRGRGVDGAGKQDFAMLGLSHLEGRGWSQKIGNPALVPRRQVLDHNDTAGKIPGQRSQHLGKSAQTSCGRSHRYDIKVTERVRQALGPKLVLASHSDLLNRVIATFLTMIKISRSAC